MDRGAAGAKIRRVSESDTTEWLIHTHNMNQHSKRNSWEHRKIVLVAFLKDRKGTSVFDFCCIYSFWVGKNMGNRSGQLSLDLISSITLHLLPHHYHVLFWNFETIADIVSSYLCVCVYLYAAAAKSLQSCPTLCDPIDGSPPGSSVPGILQARILEWVAIFFSNACMHVKSLQSCPTLCDPMDSSPPSSSVQRILQARILEWVAISFSCICMSINIYISSIEFSRSVMSSTLQPHGLQDTMLPCPPPTSRAHSNSYHRVSDAIQPPHTLSSSSPPAFNLSQHQGLKWVSSSHQVAKVLELQLQHQSFQWTPRTDFL